VAFDVLYVSPHADDVAFSAAAQVARDVASGLRVAVLTVFEMPEGSPYGAFGERATRRAEDEAFAALAGVQRIGGGFDDAIARRPRYRSPHKILAPLADDEASLVDAVRQRIESYVKDGCQRVVAPLGIGEHVDHQIVHEAARTLNGAEVSFYEDTPHMLSGFALAQRLARLGLQPEPSPGTGAKPSADPTIRRGSPWEELIAAIKAWWSLPLLDLMLGVMPGAPRPWWLGIARSLMVAYLFAPYVLWPRRLRCARPVRSAATSIVRGADVAAVKLAAIGAYTSQWPCFHTTLDAWREALQTYAHKLSEDGVVERVWRVAKG
jgi:LmbE family N-acetylglucosaminyl deacetylase